MQRKRKPLTQLTFDDQEKRRRNANDMQNCSKQTEARAGTVSRIVLKNFMCHSHLEVSFNQNINYVIGRNGSGKSAILTSLIVGLGGKASLTNRGNSIKGFIKAGKNSGSVEVTLRNQGPMAYRYNDYGNEITIVRNFTMAGCSSYKIKSERGEIISTQSKEIQRICTNLNIQIDNPVCLLNQDTSRNFLNTKDPTQKFVLFMRATRLEMLFEEYRKMSSNKKEAVRMFKEKEKLYEELRKELSILKQKMLDQRSILLLKEKVVSLQQEIMWAKVKDAELEMNTIQENVAKLANEEITMQSDMTSGNNKLERYRESMQTLQHQVAELLGSIEEQNVPQNALVRVLGELKQALNDKQREKRVITKEIAVKTGNCKILKDEIGKFTENLNQIEEEKLKRLEEVKAVEQKIKDVEGLLETSNNDQFQMRNSVNRVQEQEHNVLMEIREIDSEIDKAQKRLKALKADSDVLSLYGRDMPRIVEAIKQAESKFTHLPRGPLGHVLHTSDFLQSKPLGRSHTIPPRRVLQQEESQTNILNY